MLVQQLGCDSHKGFGAVPTSYPAFAAWSAILAPLQAEAVQWSRDALLIICLVCQKLTAQWLQRKAVVLLAK